MVGSMDDGPSRTYLSSRPTFKFPDIGYSGYWRVFQLYLSLSFAWLYLRSEPDFSNALRDTLGFRRPVCKLAEIEISRKHSVRVSESSRSEST